MRRLPHRARILRPSTVTDAYGDTVEGPLEPVGEPFQAWLQSAVSKEAIASDGPVKSTPRVFVFPSAPAVGEADVLEVDGVRYRVEGDPREPVNPRGRSRFRVIELSRVTRGGPA